jgi:hypothetical protein
MTFLISFYFVLLLLYVDDVQLLFTCKKSEIIQYIKFNNENLRVISNWGKCSGIQLNLAKTNIMVIAHPNDLKTIDFDTLPPSVLTMGF